MLKLSIGWVIAGVATLGAVALAAMSNKSSGPKALVKVPFNPGESDCDVAYASLPDDVQEMYNNAVIAANVDTAKLVQVKSLVNAIAQNPDIDDVAKRTFQKCFWKKAALTGQATVAEAIAAVPSLAPVLSGNALPEGGDDVDFDPITGEAQYGGDDEADFDPITEDAAQQQDPYSSPPQVQLALAPKPSIFDALTPTSLTVESSYEGPAVNALPESAIKREILNALSGVNYGSLYDDRFNLCFADGNCNPLYVRAVMSKLQEIDLGFGTAQLKSAALEELGKVLVRMDPSFV
jgi:hypothetical protein